MTLISEFSNGRLDRLKDVRYIQRLIKRCHPCAKSICEVGSSYGIVLGGLSSLGYEVKGYEISEISSEIGRSKLNLNVERGSIPENSSNKYDVILMRYVLEHLVEPFSELGKLWKLTAANGVILIAVPNIQSLAARLLRQNWPRFCPPIHLYYFSSKTLTRTLEQSGFSPMKIITKKGDALNMFFLLLRQLARDAFGMKPLSRQLHRKLHGQTVLKRRSWARCYLKQMLLLGTDVLYLALYPAFWLINALKMGQELLDSSPKELLLNHPLLISFEQFGYT